MHRKSKHTSYKYVACFVYHYLEKRNGKEPNSSGHEIWLVLHSLYSQQAPVNKGLYISYIWVALAG
jgi:hypothetical protein